MATSPIRVRVSSLKAKPPSPTAAKHGDFLSAMDDRVIGMSTGQVD
jgi:hypothetical protein